MNGLISDKLNSDLDLILAKCFEVNRISDRIMTTLGVKFAMNRTVKFLHPKFAHAFPLLADKISDYQGSRNNLTFYGATPADGTIYNSPMECFKRMLEYTIELESMVGEVLDYARDEDPVTCVFLEHFLRKLNPYTSQCLLLIDKSESYKENWALFDADVKKFIIL